MEQNYRALQNENYQLREYILNLQSRLLETSSEYPPAPSHINLSAGAPAPPTMTGSAGDPSNADQQVRRDMDPSTRHEAHHQDGMSQLQAAAAQASEIRHHESPYGLGSDYPHKRGRTDEAGVSTGDAKPA